MSKYLLLLAALLATGCTKQAAINAGKELRNSLCEQKYGRDCIDPGVPRRGPPNHNDPLEDLSPQTQRGL